MVLYKRKHLTGVKLLKRECIRSSFKYASGNCSVKHKTLIQRRNNVYNGVLLEVRDQKDLWVLSF